MQTSSFTSAHANDEEEEEEDENQEEVDKRDLRSFPALYSGIDFPRTLS